MVNKPQPIAKKKRTHGAWCVQMVSIINSFIDWPISVVCAQCSAIGATIQSVNIFIINVCLHPNKFKHTKYVHNSIINTRHTCAHLQSANWNIFIVNARAVVVYSIGVFFSSFFFSRACKYRAFHLPVKMKWNQACFFSFKIHKLLKWLWFMLQLDCVCCFGFFLRRIKILNGKTGNKRVRS